MALTIGSAPFSEQPEGRFDVDPPARPLLFWEPFPKRLRVIADGETVIDSRSVVALHETGRMMRLCVPWRDMRRDRLRETGAEEGGRLGSLTGWSRRDGSPLIRSIDRPAQAAAALAGLVIPDLAAADAWYLEDEPGYAHPRDPYHRFDVHRASRHVVVSVDNIVIAETRAPAMLFETSTPVRYYLPPEAVRTELLIRSDTVSQCPYKGDGQHWHVQVEDRRIDDACWGLVTPMGDALAIPRWFSFYPEKIAIAVDGEPLT